MRGGGVSPRQLIATRRVDRVTRACSTPGKRPSARSIAWTQPPQWIVGTDRSLCRTPPPRTRLASSTSPSPSGTPSLIVSGRGGHAPDRAPGVPGAVAERREDHDQAEETGRQAEHEEGEDDGAP